MDSPY